MSASIVSNQTINAIVNFVTQQAGGGRSHAWQCQQFLDSVLQHALRDGATGTPPPSSASELHAWQGRQLYDLNVEAVSQRYPGESVATLPGPITAGYTYRSGLPVSPIQAYKHLGCLISQCSEGNVPERSLYKALDTLYNQMAHTIVSGLPEYERAERDAACTHAEKEHST